MLRAIEYFAKSLEVIQCHWKWHHSVDCIRLALRNYGSILYHFRDKARRWSKIAIFNPSAFEAFFRCPRRNIAVTFSVDQKTKGQSNLTKSASRGGAFRG